MLGIVYSVDAFQVHVHGVHFTIVTNHMPLLWLMTKWDLTGQRVRWTLALQAFDLNIAHWAGSPHVGVHAVFRITQPGDSDYTGAGWRPTRTWRRRPQCPNRTATGRSSWANGSHLT